MKNKIISVLILTALMLPQALLFSSCGKKDAPPPLSPPQFSGEGSNVIEADLFGMSPSELYLMFSEALSRGTDVSGSLGAYNLSAALSGKRRFVLKDGIAVYSEGDKLKYAASLGSGGLRLVTLTEDGSDYILNENTASTNTAAFEWIPKIKETLAFAEEHFVLPVIEKSNVVIRDDGIYYLSEEFKKELLTTLFSAYRCIELGVLPSELSEEELEEIKENSRQFASKTKSEMGFGLVMKRVQSVKLEFSADGIGEYTDGRLDFAAADVTVSLDADRKNLTFAKGRLSERSVSSGNAEVDFNLNTIFNTSGKLVHIFADINAKFKDVKIGEEGSADTRIDVIGNREMHIQAKFSPFAKTESINLAVSNISYRCEKPETPYANTAFSLNVGAFSVGTSAPLSFSYSVDGVKTTLGGEAVTGNTVALPELPARVSELLGTKKPGV